MDLYSIREGDDKDDFGELIEFNNDGTANVFLSNQFMDWVFTARPPREFLNDIAGWHEKMRSKLKISQRTYSMLRSDFNERKKHMNEFVKDRSNWIQNVPIVEGFCGRLDLSKKIIVTSIFDKVDIEYYQLRIRQ